MLDSRVRRSRAFVAGLGCVRLRPALRPGLGSRRRRSGSGVRCAARARLLESSCARPGGAAACPRDCVEAAAGRKKKVRNAREYPRAYARVPRRVTVPLGSVRQYWTRGVRSNPLLLSTLVWRPALRLT